MANDKLNPNYIKQVKDAAGITLGMAPNDARRAVKKLISELHSDKGGGDNSGLAALATRYNAEMRQSAWKADEAAKTTEISQKAQKQESPRQSDPVRGRGFSEDTRTQSQTKNPTDNPFSGHEQASKASGPSQADKDAAAETLRQAREASRKSAERERAAQAAEAEVRARADAAAKQAAEAIRAAERRATAEARLREAAAELARRQVFEQEQDKRRAAMDDVNKAAKKLDKLKEALTGKHTAQISAADGLLRTTRNSAEKDRTSVEKDTQEAFAHLQTAAAQFQDWYKGEVKKASQAQKVEAADQVKINIIRDFADHHADVCADHKDKLAAALTNLLYKGEDYRYCDPILNAVRDFDIETARTRLEQYLQGKEGRFHPINNKNAAIARTELEAIAQHVSTFAAKHGNPIGEIMNDLDSSLVGKKSIDSDAYYSSVSISHYAIGIGNTKAAVDRNLDDSIRFKKSTTGQTPEQLVAQKTEIVVEAMDKLGLCHGRSYRGNTRIAGLTPTQQAVLSPLSCYNWHHLKEAAEGVTLEQLKTEFDPKTLTKLQTAQTGQFNQQAERRLEHLNSYGLNNVAAFWEHNRPIFEDINKALGPYPLNNRQYMDFFSGRKEITVTPEALNIHLKAIEDVTRRAKQLMAGAEAIDQKIAEARNDMHAFKKCEAWTTPVSSASRHAKPQTFTAT